MKFQESLALGKEGYTMIESYSSYVNRIGGLIGQRVCFPQENEPLVTEAGVKMKCNDDGSFRPFYGDTVVFRLPEPELNFFGSVQGTLYDLAGDILAEKIPVNSLHITLHDLSSSMINQEIESAFKSHQEKLSGNMTNLKNKGNFCLLIKGMMSMVSSSVVMIFEPIYEDDHNRIQDMYDYIECIHPLPYPLTLHCTLAYYKPGKYMPIEWKRLYEFICQWNNRHGDGIRFTLDSNMVEYQVFDSMKNYSSVF